MASAKSRRRPLSALQETLYAIAFRVQPGLKEFESAVLQHVVLRNLAALESKGREGRVRDIAKCSGFDGNLSLQHTAVVTALSSLEKAGKVEVQGNPRHPRSVTASLSAEGRNVLAEEDRQASDLLERVFRRLLSDLPGERWEWEEALLFCLSSVFSQLGREYAAVLAKRKATTEVVTVGYMDSLTRRVARDYDAIDPDDLSRVMRRFFDEQTPDFMTLIWHLAQTHFALRELRMGFAGAALRNRLLENKTFYLDTNVLFQIAIEGMPRSESMRVFVDACRDARASVRIGKPSVDEFSRSLTKQVAEARSVLPKIPPALAEELSDPVYCAYEAANQTAAVPLEDVLAAFESPRRIVNHLPGVQIQDDQWFDTVTDSREFAVVVEQIRNKSRELKGYPKFRPLAEHDAKMLLYVLRESREGRNSTFVTLDSTLPRCEIAGEGPSLLVAPLDALLQWACPALGGITDAQTLAEIFTAALVARIFPWEEHLHLEHFVILDSLELGCFDLPEDDLRDCVRHMENIVPTADPTTAEGKLSLMAEMQRYIAGPGKRYQQDLSKEREKRLDAEGRLVELQKGIRQSCFLRALLSLSLLALSVFVADRFAPGDTLWGRIASLYSLIALLACAPWISSIVDRIRRLMTR